MSALLQKNNRKLKETITVKKAMKSTMVFAVLATIVFTILYRITENGVLLSLAITAGTISYHFVMRYTVAGVFSHTMHNRANLSRKWYQQKKWEKKLYRKLHVKQWKNKMPTYEPSYFDLRLHTPEEIAGAMCQAEVSHEVIVIFSFLPLFTVPAFGAFWVFLITSVLSALMDLLFAIMQRYNRPRILKLCRK
ncbi:hypothetical protein [Eubacterium ramulus]|jgi:glycosyl-4,4'-diaponeurosporenoate acyltransferase|nr:hypothetical protein [Eubacterium ramulus]